MRIIFYLRKIYHSKYLPIFLKSIFMSIYTLYKKIKDIFSPASFKSKNILLIGNPVFLNKKGFGYIALYYRESLGVLKSDYKKYNSLLKKEVIFGKKTKKISIEVSEKSLIPISILNEKAFTDSNSNKEIFFKVNNEVNLLKNTPQNRFNYIKVYKNSSVFIESESELIIGKPIALTQKQKNKKKLVIVLFLDGLTGSLINKNIQEIMPYTYDYFKDDFIFDNCFSNTEYTHTSLATMFTGKYVKNLNYFHPRKYEELGKDYKLISEFFKDAGYLTHLVTANPSQSLKNGYCKGFDRAIFKNDLSINEIIYEFIENARTFPDRDIFSWLSIFDTHHILNHVPDINTQSNLSINAHNYEIKGLNLKTPFSLYSEESTERYINELKRVDYQLNYLYEFIKNNYSEDEVLITLTSDHATSHTININHNKHILRLLKKEKINVPLMIKSNSFKGSRSNEYIENIDLLPTLLKLSGIANSELESFDGRVPNIFGGKSAREFIFSESLYPNQTYKATIKSKIGEYFFEAEKYTDDNGEVYIGEFSDFYLENENSNFSNEIIDNFKKTSREYIFKHLGIK